MVFHFVPLQKEIYIARAPGRLDVMGGIADYSGSLVLQVCSILVEQVSVSLQYYKFS
jgi:galactokinase